MAKKTMNRREFVATGAGAGVLATKAKVFGQSPAMITSVKPIVIAAGNDFQDGNPTEVIAEIASRVQGAVSVAAVDRASNHAFYSSTGSWIELSAPGGAFPTFGREGLIFQQTLDGLDPKEVPNLDKAHRNVAEFAEELLARILAEQVAQQNEDRPARAAGG